MLGPGTYENATITGSALVKNKGNPDLFDIEVYFMADGDTITAWLYTSPEAWPFTKEKLAACGFDADTERLSSLNLEGDANPIKGHVTRIVVEEKEYQGKLRAKVVAIGSGGAYQGERMSDTEAIEFEKKLRRRLTATEGNSRAAAPAQAKRTPPSAAKTSAAAASGPAPSDEAPW